MSESIKERVLDGIAILSGLSSAASFLLDQPVLFFVLLVITLGLLIRRGVVTAQGSEQRIKTAATEPAQQSPIETFGQKKWIDCAYCEGSGSIVTYNDGHTQKNESCGICQGHGQVFTDLWNRPACRRCGGSGRLVIKQYTPTLQLFGRRILKHHQFDTLVQPCDVCGGFGRRPWHVDERNG